MHILIRIIRETFFQPLRWPAVFKIAFWRPALLRVKIIFFGPYSVKYYPSKLRRIVENLNIFESTSVPNHPQIWPFLSSFKRNLGSEIVINLAGRKTALSNIESLWDDKNNGNEDVEFHSALHRFHWLLQVIAQDYDEKLLDETNRMISSWIGTHQKPLGSNLEWHPYNVSERIINLIIYIQALRLNKFPIDDLNIMIISLRDHASYLVKNLEYPASGVINNHVINNARALYFGGVFLESKDLISVAKFLFRQHLGSMIDEFGLLLEGSSHYQLLVTRSLLEVRELADFVGDPDFYFEVNNVSNKMLESSQFLMVGKEGGPYEFPLIGDVSPDMPANWFCPLETRNKTGWQRIWQISLPNLTDSETQQKGDWYRFESGTQMLITHVHKIGKEYPVGHGHNDFGGFALYLDNNPLIIDVGRYSYQKKQEEGPNSIDNRHNIVYVNDVPILSRSTGINSLLEESEKQFFSDLLSNNKKTLTLEASNKHKKLYWKRLITSLDDKSVLIEDQVIGAKEIKGYFHLGIEVRPSKIKGGDISLKLKNNEYLIKSTESVSIQIENCLIYESYGKKNVGKRIKWISISQCQEHFINFMISRKEE